MYLVVNVSSPETSHGTAVWVNREERGIIFLERMGTYCAPFLLIYTEGVTREQRKKTLQPRKRSKGKKIASKNYTDTAGQKGAS